jgi:hypothetical protein
LEEFSHTRDLRRHRQRFGERHRSARDARGEILAANEFHDD